MPTQRNTIFLFIQILSMFIIFNGCKSQQENTEENGTESDTLIIVTEEQYKSGMMQLGNPMMKDFEEKLHLRGWLEAPVNARAEVSLHVPGIIRSLNYPTGSFVQKGAVLGSVESKEIITLQHQYSEAIHNLKIIRSDYDRIKTLAGENIASTKELSAIENQYNSQQARVNGLKTELQMLKISIEELEKGIFQQTLYILAPASGYITKQNCITGQYIQPGNLLIELVDLSKLQLHFRVFETDIEKVRPGQSITFYRPGLPGQVATASITTIGKTVNPDDKTVLCIANIQSALSTQVAGMYVETELILASKQALALPNEAIVKSGDRSYIFKLVSKQGKQYVFFRAEIQTGAISAGYTEIVQNIDLKDVLIKGAFNLFSE